MINKFFSYKTRLYIFENRIQCIIQDKLHVVKKNYDNQNSLFYLYSSSLHKASVMKNMNLISSCCQYALFIAGFFYILEYELLVVSMCSKYILLLLEGLYPIF